MEERDMKILAGRILKGDFDEELEAAQKIQSTFAGTANADLIALTQQLRQGEP